MYSYTLKSGKANQAQLRSSRVSDTRHIRHVSSLSDTVAIVMLPYVLPYSPRHQNARVASLTVCLLPLHQKIICQSIQAFSRMMRRRW